MRLFFCVLIVFSGTLDCHAQDVANIGSRRELFVDNYLIDELKDLSLELQEPTKKEVVLVHDEPWEGSGSGYHSVFKDGDLYRMYYKAWQHDASSDLSNHHPLFCAYAESKDGIHWYKPNLGLHEYNGSKDNNIVFSSEEIEGLTVDAGHPAVFKDENPNAPADERYKAFLVQWEKPNRGLIAFKSPDGIHWTLMANKPVIADGAFDSQNLAFWDPTVNKYRAYWRYFDELDVESGVSDVVAKSATIKEFGGVRAIRTALSDDFIHWDHQTNVTYLDSPPEELYTNQIMPYYRAPHIYIGFPARYVDRGWSPSMNALPELEERKKRSAISERFGTALSETLFMTSRDGQLFNRWNEAFIRPGIERPGTWTYGDTYAAWHIVETKSEDAGAPNELSLYMTENYWKGKASSLRRYTMRLDGFVSVSASAKVGELLTKPFVFEGSKLVLNFSTSAMGDIYVEITDEHGNPLPGFAMEDCAPVFGDTIDRVVYWESGSDVSSLSGRPVRLKFVMKDADLFSFQFH